MGQLENLAYMLHSGTLTGLDDEPPAPDVTPSDPVGRCFEKAKFKAAGGPANFVDSSESSALAKHADAEIGKAVFRNRLGLSHSPFGSAAALAERTNAAGGILEKRAADEGTTVDLSKAASPHRVRYERTMLDGSEWVLGWNDRGENCYASPLEDHQRVYGFAEVGLPI